MVTDCHRLIRIGINIWFQGALVEKWPATMEEANEFSSRLSSPAETTRHRLPSERAGRTFTGFGPGSGSLAGRTQSGAIPKVDQLK